MAEANLSPGRVLLDIQALWTSYGHIVALKNISMQVYEGEIVAIIGANGAGKSTLLNSISGVVPARQGKIVFDGQEITRRPPDAIVGLGISQVPERRQIFSTLSVRDNLLLGAYLRLRQGKKQEVVKDLEYIFCLFSVLQEREQQLAGTLSGGEQQMLAIGRGLMARPRLLLLDEPSLGLAPLLVAEIFRTLEQLRRRGTTILLVEQNARQALEISDRAYVLETGRIELSGRSKDLIANEEVKKAYLGRMDRHPKRKGVKP